MSNILITDFTDERFEEAFKTYFDEIGCRCSNWNKMFDMMNNDEHGKNFAYLKLSENGEVMGFIQFSTVTMKSWFFISDMGFIREFWVDKKYRGSYYGKELLELAEDYFVEHGLHYSILTTDTAEGFYIKNGYKKAQWITAENEDTVMVKEIGA